MSKHIILVIACLALLTGAASSQEVVITDFPLGVGGSVSSDIFKPHYEDFRAIAEILKNDPLARAIVTGGADGETYRQSHDAKNPSLALGRAHTLRSLLMNEFGVDSTQIVIRTEDVKEIGGQYRYVSVRVARELSDMDGTVAHLKARVDTLEQRPPVEKHFTEIREVPAEIEIEDDLGLRFGLGVSSSPFGAIPVVTSAISLKRFVFLEGIVGHTFWNGDFTFEGENLETKRRLLGGHVIVYPFENLPLGFLGGWLRVEEVAQDYYEYAKLSEGLVLGARITPLEFLSVTAAYNPSEERVVDRLRSTSKNGQFLMYVTAHISLGGAK